MMVSRACLPDIISHFKSSFYYELVNNVYVEGIFRFIV